MTLTAKAVEAAKPREKAYKLADGAGLYLYVSPASRANKRVRIDRAGWVSSGSAITG